MHSISGYSVIKKNALKLLEMQLTKLTEETKRVLKVMLSLISCTWYL